MTIRKIDTIFSGAKTLEGAGVTLFRLFGSNQIPQLDPFLLLDHFGSNNPEEYLAGFPWHPHRGIETVTYIIKGSVEHSDSLGNKGVIRDGDVQWMTAGSGIIHQEMPQKIEGTMMGFQLWVNLSARNKMMKPKYRSIENTNIPRIEVNHGVHLSLICGTYKDVTAAITDAFQDVHYIDITLAPNTTYIHPVHEEHTAFVYMFQGSAVLGNDADSTSAKSVHSGQVAFLKEGDGIAMRSLDETVRCILVTGKPLHEPIAWGGPIVMNTQEELMQSFNEFRNGTFVSKND